MMFGTVKVGFSNVVGRHNNVACGTMDSLPGVGTVVQVVRFERFHLKIKCSLIRV